MNSELLHGFWLGPWLVEPLKGQVSGKGGMRHLPPKAVEVLLCLAERPLDLVTHGELLEKAWGQDGGSNESLVHAIGEIRHAFDDHYDDPRVVQTLPRRGYRLLVEPVADVEASAATLPPKKLPPRNTVAWWERLLRHGVIQATAAYLVSGWLLIQVADTVFAKIGLPPWCVQFVTFVVIGGIPLVICLAWFFEFVEGRLQHDRGEQPGGLLQGLERNYLAIVIAYGVAAVGGGIYQWTVGFDVPTTTETVTTTELIPIARSSIAVLQLATFDDDPKTRAFSDGLSEDLLDGLARIPGLSVPSRGDTWSLSPHASSEAVRRRLRVAHYIEGSVRFFDDRLKVVVQLIDSETGLHLFSRDYETDLAGFGQMQQEITKLVIANLKLAVDESLVTPALVSADTDDPDAFVFYMMGRDVMYEPTTVETVQHAVDLFRQALALDNDYPAAHAGLCNAYVQLYRVEDDTANIELAEAACSRALSVAPRLPIVLHSVGSLYFLTNRLNEAEAAYQTALDIDDHDAEALRGLALVRRQQQRLDEAIDLMQRSIELQPGNWHTINSLGGMYFRMGAYRDAAEQYRKVVYLDPDNFVTLGNLGATSLMFGDFEAARDALLRAIEIEENPTLLQNLAGADYYLGNYASAIDNYRRAIELAPTSIESWIGLADALLVSGDAEQARPAYSHCVELANTQREAGAYYTHALMILAWATAMSGDAENAVSLVQTAVESDPALPYAHYYASLVHWYVGDRNMAFTAVEQALATGYPVAMLEAEPLLQELRRDSRFETLIREYRD